MDNNLKSGDLIYCYELKDSGEIIKEVFAISSIDDKIIWLITESDPEEEFFIIPYHLNQVLPDMVFYTPYERPDEELKLVYMSALAEHKTSLVDAKKIRKIDALIGKLKLL